MKELKQYPALKELKFWLELDCNQDSTTNSLASRCYDEFNQLLQKQQQDKKLIKELVGEIKLAKINCEYAKESYTTAQYEAKQAKLSKLIKKAQAAINGDRV